MGVKDIFGKFLNHEPAEGANYLSLTLTPDKILASIWRIAIDTAAKNITADVDQVVFGLSDYWFEGGKPTKETTDILKNLAQELELDAQAFVPLAASIAHSLSLKGESKNAIFIGAFKDYTEVSLIKNGSAISSEHKGKATIQDISRLIDKFREIPDQILPKHVVVFGDNALELKNELGKKKEHSVFEEGATIETLTNEEVAHCIAYSQAADVLGSEPQLGAVSTLIATQESEIDEGKVQELQEKPEMGKEELKEPGEEFDFKEGKDVLENPVSQSQEDEKLANGNLTSPSTNDEYAVEVNEKAHGYETPAQKLQESTGTKKESLIESILTLNWVSKITKGSKKKILAPIAVLTIVILVIVYILGFTITSVKVLVKASSRPIDDTFDVTVAQGAALDTLRSRIPGEETAATVKDSSQAQATGIKKTGNNSKGEVKVFNWTTSKVDFDAGTVIISKNGIKFELNSDVEIASRSASSPGESLVGVTAQEFGENGNLSAGTEFTFQQYDELLYSAKNDIAFSGGDEKEINIVTKKDQDDLAKTLENSLTQKAKEELKQKVTDKEILDESIEIKVLKKQFDKDIDEEATSFMLDMEIEASALSFKEETLKEFLAKISKDKAEDNLESLPDNIEILELDVTRGKDTLNLEGKYRAYLVPKINEDSIRSTIAGKGQKSARQLIKQNSEISDVDFIFSPNLIIFSSLPKNKDKISIKVEAIK
ncbi:MAG: hypothetical protein UU23_C0004G0053 [Candidatus Curtissbacteria bacterium GW2011_GWA1_40_9]|uniref:Baseplate protein J-like barrel domain-containing protein n=1 Tax=Candidatus Curtissbacteria bacterium GW2011_GWA1_40_9 TaxID=1618408 RepID=A0A0G0TT86_9BACT|nr:MAG: hypothetical protein UU23_C0004G0053 [Candidatus Curtissbacteria bacterium GW2011_GWA1_40_9]